ncbi:MAG: hypothetical protein NTX27_04810 [Verrucomicrobia bacterium]|nr:hypothetical protein [Verrucomicrobiota bacterium]
MNKNLPNLAGFERLRLLSEGERTWTWLVRGADGLLVLKGEQPGIGVDGGTLLARYERLKELSPGPGLLPILGCGVAEDGWVWHLVPLGDNLPGMPGLETAAGIEQYTPMTLRMRTQESGPAGARQVAEWGQRLCGGLELLHRSGLLHRGIQPSNVVFLQGEPRLGDYSRVGEAGSRVQMEGMEGFEPVLGGNSEEGDLHALGRTLYEAWTGRDRMEFPSLSRRVLESSEWAECGLGLNDAILKSDRGRENGGFRSAGEFGKALLDAGIGRRKVNRRAWLRSAVLAGLGVGAGFAILRGLRPVPRLHWELVGEDGFNVEGWGEVPWTADWENRRIHSVVVNSSMSNVDTLDVDTLKVETTRIDNRSGDVRTLGWHPVRKSLLGVTPFGDVFEWRPGARILTRLGGNVRKIHMQGDPFWNPVTGRIGMFGGYGHFRVRNGRAEFDVELGEWVEVEVDDPARSPWPRISGLLAVDEPGRDLYVVGGWGCPSGEQWKEKPGLAGYDGTFHVLDDVWKLNLATGRRQQLLPPGMLGLGRAAAVFFDQPSGSLIVVLRRELLVARPERARAVMVDRTGAGCFVELGMEGTPPGLGKVRGYNMDPRDGRLLVLASDGIYRVRIIRPS